MSRLRLPSAVFNAIGLCAAVAAIAAGAWLMATYIQARRVLPAEKALVESLKQQARTSVEIQKVLQPETDRQHEAAVARRNVYRRGGFVLLVSGAVFVAWRKRVRRPLGTPAKTPVSTQTPAGPPQVVAAAATGKPAAIDLSVVDDIVKREGGNPDAAIPVLQAIQEHYRYIPDAALRRVCETTGITPAQLAGVASFYGQFRQTPVGAHIVHVCEGTACHVAGAAEVRSEVRRCLGIGNGSDTDSSGQFTVERVACVGSCSLAPVITIDDRIYGHVSALSAGRVLRDFIESEKRMGARPGASGARGSTQERSGAVGGHAQLEIRVGVGSCGIASGAREVHAALQSAARASGARVHVKAVGCAGLCHSEPLVEVVGHSGRTRYGRVRPENAALIVRTHAKPDGWAGRLRAELKRARARLLDDAEWMPLSDQVIDDGPYLAKQVRVVLENCGEIDPLSIGEYRARGGFEALTATLSASSPEEVIAAIRDSGLRGRGGAGFPTGAKWAFVGGAPGTKKYVICNGDEGDPGAFMDRAVLEADPFRVVEGLTIAAYAVGAHEGFVYVRREYPVAVRHIRAGIRVAEQHGLIGENILGSGFSFTLQVREGAGAFVCGEETALIQSIEGQRGMPRLRPPYPARAGLWGRPTLINNVETLACVPWILRHGAEAFAAMGSARSRGTKVFSLAGKINRGGLIEVPMGITIREIVREIGGGIKGGRDFKAVLLGGPSGGCIPARLADTRIDYEELASTGAIMGSGGLVVLDERDCAVEIARYFLHFTQSESCGKCTYCRIGTKRMLEILERICGGKGCEADLQALEELGNAVKRGSLCGLGQTAPNPVLTTLRYFRDEYEAHIRERRCPAAQCKALIHFRVRQRCTGCTLCAQACPAGAIVARPYERHEVADDLCTRCGMCVSACPEDAIEVA